MNTEIKNQSGFLLLLGLLVVLLFLRALDSGPVNIPLLEVLSNWSFAAPSIDQTILQQVRLPRALLTVMVGATLGLAGAALQGLLRNPLAGPGIIGVTNSASLGAVAVIYFGVSTASGVLLPAAAMVGAGASVLIAFSLTGRDGSVLTLILVGVALNAIAGALTAFLLNIAPSPYAINEMLFWLLGSVSNRTMSDVLLAAPFMLAGGGLLLASHRFLDALSLGEETAYSLGFNVILWRWLLVIGVAASVGAAVSVSGSIAFVGLMIPHLLRPLVGYRPSALLPASALGGAILLLLAEQVVHLVPTAAELRLGVVTSLVGGPFFLWLILSTRKNLS